MTKSILTKKFFDRDSLVVAKGLLGKVLCVKYKDNWLQAIITETEAYYIDDRASHASLGYTEKRKALFMEPGTIYMYHSRGGDSLNFSCRGEGNAVLIKKAAPFLRSRDSAEMVRLMQHLNPHKNSKKPRPLDKLCSGQALLCRALGLKVKDWDQKQLDRKKFYLASFGMRPKDIIQTTRLGIPKGRDEHLPYRFIWINSLV